MSSAAPIYSLMNDARAKAESAAWAQFSSPRDRAEFCASWLTILCAQIEQVFGAVVLLQSDEGGYTPAAVWPDASRNMQYLAPVAERTLRERRGVVAGPQQADVLPAADEPAYVGYPIEISGALHGAVVLHLPPGGEAALQRATRLVHWASAWLIDQFRAQQLQAEQRKALRLSMASEVLATALQEHSLGSAANAVVNELATRLPCERVSIGFELNGSMAVKAISHTATFDRKTDVVRLIEDAMDEVLDLDATLRHPPPHADAIEALAHGELAAQTGHAYVLSVPLVHGGHCIGAITLERRADQQPFDADTEQLAKTCGLMLGPVFDMKRAAERSAWQRSRDGLRGGATALFGPRHPGLKLASIIGLLLLAALSLIDSQYRVTAKTVVEGAVQRVAAAPFEGFIAESFVRAGDKVRKGQVLARIDDRNLALEQAKWSAEVAQARSRQRSAAASLDRTAMAIAGAQVDQAQAQLDLVEDKIRRAKLLAPFDGIVVSGDLSQLLGSPVEQGKVLFEVAPLDAYRVILNVDERDIAAVKLGQKGEIALSGLPHKTLPMTVSQITPVSTAQDGHNFFRVEASLKGAPPQLRPGMEGIGKVDAGERRLIWIWTHGLVDWLRLWLWRWTA